MRRFLLTLITLSTVACATHQTESAPSEAKASSQTFHYTFLMAEKVAGEQVTTVHPDGRRTSHFEFNDRGRGPKIDSTFEMRGTVPVRITVAGNDYFKSPVAESFVYADGVARWESSTERGEKRSATPAFYSAMNGSYEDTAMMIRAALERSELPLYPSGTAVARAVATHTLPDGEVVTLYDLRGLSLTPAYAWLDDQRELFAVTGSWSSLIRKGYESNAQALLEAESKFSDAFHHETSRALTPAAVGATVIRNGSIFDPSTKKIATNRDILVRGKRIEAVAPNIAPPAGSKVIDASGKTIVPGLWDMHAHLFESDALLHLAAGVTSLRDLANDTDTLFKLIRRIEGGELLGPRVPMIAGMIDGPGPYAGPTKVLVATDEEGRAAIDNYKKLGYHQVKLYSSLEPKLVPSLVSYAHENGLRVSGHIPAFMNAEEAVRIGFDEIQHANMIFLNFYRDVGETRTPARFTTVADRAADLDLTSKVVRDFVTLLRDRKVVVDPTVSIFEEMFTARKGSVSPGFSAIADRLPTQVQRGLYSGGLPVPEGKDEQYQRSFEKMLQMTKLLFDSGVQLVAGTDSFAGFALHRELENYVRAGIPAGDVLRIATLDAARIAKRDHDLGSITEGKLADLVIIDGDPLADITNIRRVTHVMKDGVLYDSKAIYAALSIK